MRPYPVIVAPYEGMFGDGYAVASDDARTVFSRHALSKVPPVLPHASGAAVLFDDAEIGDLELDTFIESVASIDSEVSKALLERVGYLDAIALTYDVRARATHVHVHEGRLTLTRYGPREGRIQGTKRSERLTGTIDDSVTRTLTAALRSFGVDYARTWIATGDGLTTLTPPLRVA